MGCKGCGQNPLLEDSRSGSPGWVWLKPTGTDKPREPGEAGEAGRVKFAPTTFDHTQPNLGAGNEKIAPKPYVSERYRNSAGCNLRQFSPSAMM
jgi:hypothetical protein